jgi:hypothetical protein
MYFSHDPHWDRHLFGGFYGAIAFAAVCIFFLSDAIRIWKRIYAEYGYLNYSGRRNSN